MNSGFALVLTGPLLVVSATHMDLNGLPPAASVLSWSSDIAGGVKKGVAMP